MRSNLGRFDLNQLSRQIDKERTDRGLAWSKVAKEVGVATSTIRRFAYATDAEAEGVLALVAWLGVAPEQFVTNSIVTGTLLAPVDEGPSASTCRAWWTCPPGLAERYWGHARRSSNS